MFLVLQVIVSGHSGIVRYASLPVGACKVVLLLAVAAFLVVRIKVLSYLMIIISRVGFCCCK